MGPASAMSKKQSFSSLAPRTTIQAGGTPPLYSSLRKPVSVRMGLARMSLPVEAISNFHHLPPTSWISLHGRARFEFPTTMQSISGW